MFAFVRLYRHQNSNLTVGYACIIASICASVCSARQDICLGVQYSWVILLGLPTVSNVSEPGGTDESVV